MKFLEFYNKEKTYYYPNNEEATPDRIAMDFAIVNSGLKLVIETDEDRIYLYTAPVTLKVLANRVGIDIAGLSDAEALVAIENKMNEPLPEPAPTPEERIASQMEFQSLLM